MDSYHCHLCGRLPPGGTAPVAVEAPTRDYRGRALLVPGVYWLCPTCRRPIATAQRCRKLQRAERK